jgi:DNA-binding PadR family transcriptional regulator
MSITIFKEVMILGILRAHPLHGYALVEVLEQGLGWTVGLNRSAVYASLRRFVKQGWLKGEVISDSNFPDREVYSLTSEGEVAFEQLLKKSLQHSAEGTYPIVALLMCLDDIDQELRQETLHTIIVQRQTRLTEVKSFLPHEGFAGQALQLLVTQLEIEISTLQKMLSN